MAGIARLKVSYLQQLNRKWALYYGVTVDQCDISVNQDLLKLPLSSDTLNALSTMAEKNQLSTITLLEMMKEGLIMPEGVNPALEIKRISAQEKLQHKKARDALEYQQRMTAQVNDQLNNDKQVQKNGNFGNGKGKA